MIEITCVNCKKRWQVFEEDWKEIESCPFCSKPIEKKYEIQINSFGDALKQIFLTQGYDVLNEKRRLIAFFMDIYTQYKQEIKIVDNFCSEDSLKKIYNSRNDILTLEREVKMMQVDMINKGISEKWSKNISESFLYGIQDVNKPIISLPNNFCVVSCNNIDNLQEQKVVTFENNTESNFVLKNIRTFSFDGSSFKAKTIYGSVFLKGETKYIGILLTYDNPLNNINVTLNWQIFKEDGTPFSEVISTTGMITCRDSSYYHSWGWPTVGNWPVGKYKIVAKMNESNELTTYFRIQNGNYDSPQIRVKEVKLFNGGELAPDIREREYATSFSSTAAKKIYFHIYFKKVHSMAYTTIDYKIFKSNGDIFANVASPIELEVGWDNCWTGYGWNTAGHWPKGRYNYEVSVGKSEIQYGTFIIT